MKDGSRQHKQADQDSLPVGGGVFVVAGASQPRTASAAHARRTKVKRVKRYMRATAELTPEIARTQCGKRAISL